ncbi:MULTISPECIES: flagellar basal body rod protein FlgB [Crateriforma]|uniref:Flagellar basal body rod protein FlgB n=1 Tax=Crateriforma conspicua TaxID=2527996 RepID=A0A5C6FNT1_9PLAN|nr:MULTISPECIES: flagellar basal body protein [Crateriforma]TWU64782.1 Flagellar basal body rod protein FlgB [Crateriforma conspicua]
MFGILNSGTLPALQETLNFAQKRHDLLASNIANLSTPGYRARDISVDDFQQALSDSIAGYNDRPSGSVTPFTRDDVFSGPRAATEQIVYHDDSDVSLEQQVTEIGKNQHLQSMAITTMRSQFALLRAAITERAT